MGEWVNVAVLSVYYTPAQCWSQTGVLVCPCFLEAFINYCGDHEEYKHKLTFKTVVFKIVI